MGVADAFTAILDEIAAAKAAVPHPIRGTVTHADPLLVVLDDDPEGEPREVTDDAAGVWAVDDVVWLELRGTDLVVTTAPTSMARLREDADDLRATVDQHTLYNAELADFVTTQVAFAEQASERLDGLDNELAAAQAGIDAASLLAADGRDKAIAALDGLEGALIDIADLPSTLPSKPGFLPSVAAGIGEFLTVKASQLIADAGAMNTAFVGQLVGDASFIGQMYTQGLVVSEGNLWPDPTFKTLIPPTWTKDGAGIKKAGTGTQAGGYVDLSEFPIAAGDTLAAQCALEFTGTTVGDFTLYVRRRTKATGEWGNPVNFGNANTSGVYSATIATDLTDGGVYDAAQIGFYCQANMPNTRSVRVSDVRVVRQGKAIHIADGTVTAPKIVASSELSAKVAQFLDVAAERVFVGGRPILDEVGEQIGDLFASTASSLADGLDAVDTAATDRLDTAIAGVTGQLDQLDAWRESLDNYVLIDGGGIFIGNRTDDFRVNINSSRMSFIEGDKEVAYVSNQALFIGDATITGTLTQGGFYWETQTSGRLDFKWGG